MRTGARSGVDVVRAGLAQLNAVDAVDLSDDQVRGEVLSLLECLNSLHGALAERIGSFDVRDLSRADAQQATSTWLTGFGRMSKGAALRWLVHGRLLRKLPALTQAMRAGTVSAEHLARIADLAQHIGVDKVRGYDEILAQLCAHAGPKHVEQACDRILALEDPDGKEPDPKEDFDKREITFSQLGTMLYVRGRLDADGGAALQTAVDALMRPPQTFDERTAAQRRADAMVDLARGALAGDHLPSVGGERPHVGLLLTPEILFGNAGEDGDPSPGGDADRCQPTQPTTDPAGPSDPHHATDLRAATCPRESTNGPVDPLTAAGVPALPARPWLNWIGAVPTELAHRLACDAILWRVVLDPRTGLPLDVGRKHRIVPWWMRKALWARDRTCRWPGCDLPTEWTDAHHLTPWWAGGTTEMSQMISVCRFHHHLVHEGQWRLTLDHTTGEVWVTRPDGSPYELGPSRPWTTPTHQGPRPGAPPGRAHPPNAPDGG
jgi:hypothetical protein